MKFFILVGGSSRTTGDLIKPKKSSKKGPKTGQKRAKIGQDSPRYAKTAKNRTIITNVTKKGGGVP